MQPLAPTPTTPADRETNLHPAPRRPAVPTSRARHRYAPCAGGHTKDSRVPPRSPANAYHQDDNPNLMCDPMRTSRREHGPMSMGCHIVHSIAPVGDEPAYERRTRGHPRDRSNPANDGSSVRRRMIPPARGALLRSSVFSRDRDLRGARVHAAPAAGLMFEP